MKGREATRRWWARCFQCFLFGMLGSFRTCAPSISVQAFGTNCTPDAGEQSASAAAATSRPLILLKRNQNFPGLKPFSYFTPITSSSRVVVWQCSAAPGALSSRSHPPCTRLAAAKLRRRGKASAPTSQSDAHPPQHLPTVRLRRILRENEHDAALQRSFCPLSEAQRPRAPPRARLRPRGGC